MPKKYQFRWSDQAPFLTRIVSTSLSLFLVVVMLVAVENSSPGDLFYGFKRAVEAAVTGLASTADAKTVDSLGLADARLEEIGQVLGATVTSQTLPSRSATVTATAQPSSGTQTTGSASSTSSPTPVATAAPSPSASANLGLNSLPSLNLNATQPELPGLGTGPIGTVVNTAAKSLNTLFGLRPELESPDQQLTKLVDEYDRAVDATTENLQLVMSSAKTPTEISEAENLAYTVAKQLISHRALLEKLSLSADNNQITLIRGPIIAIDNGNKVALSLLPELKQELLIGDIQVLNPNVDNYIKDVVAIKKIKVPVKPAVNVVNKVAPAVIGQVEQVSPSVAAVVETVGGVPGEQPEVTDTLQEGLSTVTGLPLKTVQTLEQVGGTVEHVLPDVPSLLDPH